MKLQGGAAIVTGSATGVGAAAARMLAKKGCNVVINYSRSEAEARRTQTGCESLGVEALLVKADVSQDKDCRRLAQAALDRWGRIDALVNNAGRTKFAVAADLDALSAEDFQRIFAVNVIGAFQMTRAVVPAMKRTGRGAVVNISSIAGILANGSSIAYSASKAALINMTLALARALGPEIRVNAVCPGFIQGRWLRNGLGEEIYDAMVEKQRRTTPLKAAGSPENMAEAAVWLVEGAELVTGETVTVDAGMHLMIGSARKP
jgi:3-oxoacyl-[acyl-carrier protein] reductase